MLGRGLIRMMRFCWLEKIPELYDLENLRATSVEGTRRRIFSPTPLGQPSCAVPRTK